MTVAAQEIAPVLGDAELRALEGERPSADHFDTLIDADADLYCAATGRLVVRFRRGVISPSVRRLAKSVFHDIDERLPPSFSRDSAAGRVDLDRFRLRRSDVKAVHPHPTKPFKARLELESGKILKSHLSNPVTSFLAGYNYDRYRKLGRLGGFSKVFPSDWERSVPFFDAIGALLDRHMPAVSAVMHSWCEENEVSPAFTIGRTCLSTVAVNVNYDSCFHFDRADLKNGYSTLTAVSVGKGYSGGQLVMPRWGIAIDVQEGDILFNQSHVELHGNLPVVPRAPGSKRISFVTYLKGTLRHAINSEAARRGEC